MNENQIFKEHKGVMNIDIHNDEIESTKAVVRSFDYDTGKFTYKLTKDGASLSLSGASKVNVTLMFGGEAKAVLNATTVDSVESIISFVYPEQFLSYSGQVLGEVSIQYSNGQSLVAGYFSWSVKGANIDKVAKKIPEIYWERFEDAEGLAIDTIELIEKNEVVKKAELEKLTESKADKLTVDKQVSELEKEIANTARGMVGSYNSVAELNAEYPRGAKGFALVDVDTEINGQVMKVPHTFTWNGGKWEDRGPFNGMEIPDGQVTSKKLATESVIHTKLSSQFRNAGYTSIDKLSKLIDDKTYIFQSKNVSDSPFSGSCVLNNIPVDDYLIQHVISLDKTNNQTFRLVRPSIDSASKWESFDLEIKNQSIDRLKLSANYDSKGNNSNADLNKLVDTGTYLLTGKSTNSPSGFDSSTLVSVKRGDNWGHQVIYQLQKPEQRMIRFFFTSNNLFGDWKVFTEKKLTGKTVVNFGDSLIGNTQNNTSVSAYLADFTGALVHNCGFGGCRMSKHAEFWDAFSMYRIANEIVKDNSDPTKWKLQEDSLNNVKWTSKPYYFDGAFKRLKEIDFSKVDYITISYSTNDFMGGNLSDDKNNKYNTDTFGGALRYSLEKIMTKYPKIQILVTTGTYCFWSNEDGSFKEDTFTKEFDGGKMIDFVNKAIDICENEYNVNVLDNYRKLGINKFNKEYFFKKDDGIHGIETHRKHIGEQMGKMLISI